MSIVRTSIVGKRCPHISKSAEFFTFSPTPNRVIPNDKLSHMLPNLPNEIKVDRKIPLGEALYREYVKKDLGFTVLEMTTKKYGEIITEVQLSLTEGYSDTTPLDQFDKEVLIACMSEQQYGNDVTTVDAIYRNITGEMTSKNHPSPQMRKDILLSIRKLRHYDIIIDMTKLFNLRSDYKDKMSEYLEENIIESAILPSWVLGKAVINNQLVRDVIKFDRPSPFFIVAQAKKQLFTYARCILSGSGIINSKQNVIVKNYVQQRIEEIKRCPRRITPTGIKTGMYPTLVLQDIYDRCPGLMDKSAPPSTIRNRKLKIKSTVVKFLNHLQNLEIIKGYTATVQGKKWISIAIDL